MVSVRRVVPVLLFVIATASVAGTASAQKQSSSHPPRELHRVGEHWTAYNRPIPPRIPRAPAPTPSRRAIPSGSWPSSTTATPTSGPSSGSPNTWITDAHWIYPGDVLLVGGEGTASAGATAGGEGAMTPVTPRSNTMAQSESAFSGHADR